MAEAIERFMTPSELKSLKKIIYKDFGKMAAKMSERHNHPLLECRFAEDQKAKTFFEGLYSNYKICGTGTTKGLRVFSKTTLSSKEFNEKVLDFFNPKKKTIVASVPVEKKELVTNSVEVVIDQPKEVNILNQTQKKEELMSQKLPFSEQLKQLEPASHRDVVIDIMEAFYLKESNFDISKSMVLLKFDPMDSRDSAAFQEMKIFSEMLHEQEVIMIEPENNEVVIDLDKMKLSDTKTGIPLRKNAILKLLEEFKIVCGKGEFFNTMCIDDAMRMTIEFHGKFDLMEPIQKKLLSYGFRLTSITDSRRMIRINYRFVMRSEKYYDLLESANEKYFRRRVKEILGRIGVKSRKFTLTGDRFYFYHDHLTSEKADEAFALLSKEGYTVSNTGISYSFPSLNPMYFGEKTKIKVVHKNAGMDKPEKEVKKPLHSGLVAENKKPVEPALVAEEEKTFFEGLDDNQIALLQSMKYQMLSQKSDYTDFEVRVIEGIRNGTIFPVLSGVDQLKYSDPSIGLEISLKMENLIPILPILK